MKYVLIGSHLDGNKGAASMLEAAIQTLSRADADASFCLLSMYPAGDAQLNTYKSLEVLRADPVYLGIVINSLALLYRLLPPLRGLLRRNRQICAIAEADVFLDQGGITFVDGREVFLLYNLASILPAFFIGTPVIKCSQAMGPFKGRLNRFLASIFLPRMERILARGERTHRHLMELGLNNVELVADYAFALHVTNSEADKAEAMLEHVGFSRDELNVGIFPSEVMRKKLVDQEIGYEAFMARLMDRIILEHKARVYLVPHSLRSRDKRHNNDLPVCDDIYQRVENKEYCHYITSLSSAQQLRHVIAQFDIALVARFHAMVSALSTGTPVFVTGWSHKYQEVLDMFGLDGCAMEESDITVDSVLKGFADVAAKRDAIRNRIQSRLPQVRESSFRHVELILAAAGMKEAS